MTRRHNQEKLSVLKKSHKALRQAKPGTKSH
nr:MAG TPA: hypothetical protein [Caudoviricetes sp.]